MESAHKASPIAVFRDKQQFSLLLTTINPIKKINITYTRSEPRALDIN